MKISTQKDKRAGFAGIVPLLIIIVIVAIVGVGAFMVTRKHTTNTTYQSAIQSFITAMEKKDKTTADSLESPAARAEVQKYYGTTSYYDFCQKAGELCTASFNQSYLAKATKTSKDYTAADGSKGKELVYTIKQSLTGSQAGGQSCNSSSTSTLTFAAVPKGSSWLIDKFEMGTDANAKLCPAQDGNTSFGN